MNRSKTSVRRTVRLFLTELLEGLRIAASAIWHNRLRALLTALGIIIGIASVTSMATVLNGIDREFESTLSSLGTDVFYVMRTPFVRGPNYRWWDYANRPPITADLAEDIRNRANNISAVTPVAQTSRIVSYGNRDLRASLTGASPEFGEVRNVDLAEGRFFTHTDERSSSNVCIIGARIAEELFPEIPPLGQRIRIQSMNCHVIGVRTEEGSGLFGGGNEDTQIIMPISTFQRHFGLSRFRNISVQAKVKTGTSMDMAEDELEGVLRAARGLTPLEENNFEINQTDQVRETFAPVQLAIWGVGLFLTSLALLVGGIGVMNIMYVSVKERTREIGLRKAVGARQRTILTQFLLEAVIICLIGGAIGVGISYGIAALINAAGFVAVLPFGTVVLAFGLCTLIGIGFGMAPAWKAARAEPIEALRYE